MKSFVQLLSLGLLVTCPSAIASVNARQEAAYALTVASKDNEDLNGQVLEVSDSVLGVYEGDKTPVQVYPTANGDFNSLHTWPVGIVDHVLGLKGDNGLYTLVDLMNTKDKDTADGSYYDTFLLKDGLISQNLPGGWVAFPTTNGWNVKWSDGTAFVPQSFVSVDIVYNEVQEQ
ncbi:hypothetical protein SCAR479_12332 [Seiridium cardinale]|uniref:Uncharacterized protein n=1 Tax=Seiridium cardinale TaxID=138064 RepID=A0ABR2XB42_9PEZI